MLDTSLHPGLEAIADRCELVHVTKADDPDAWHALRGKGIGSSDAGAILGLSPYAGPIEVWGEKRGYLPPKDLSQNNAVWFGTEMEDVIARWYSERTGFQVINPGCTFVLRSNPVLRTNPDRLAIAADGSLGLIEIKTADARLSDDWVDGELAPPWYQAQVAQQRAVLGPSIDWQAIVCLIGGNRPVVVPVDLTSEFVDAVAAHLIDWWNAFVVADVRPPVDAEQHTSDALRDLYPDAGTVLAADQDVLDLTVRYAHAHEAAKAAEARKRLIGNQLRAALGTNSYAAYNGVKIASWKEHSVDRFDADEHAHQQPDCHRTYRHAGSSRPLLISRSQDAVAMRERRALDLTEGVQA